MTGRCHAAALIFALYALADPPEVDDRTFGLDDLIDAVVQNVAWRNGPADMREYWAQRRGVLSELLSAGLG